MAIEACLPALVASEVARVVPLAAADRDTDAAAPPLVASDVARVVPDVAADKAIVAFDPALVVAEVALESPAAAETASDEVVLAISPAESAAEIAVAASSVGKVAAAYQSPSPSVRRSTDADVDAKVVLNAPVTSTIVTVLPDTSESLILITSS